MRQTYFFLNFNQNDKLNIEDDDHNLHCLLSNYYADNDGENPLDAFHIDSITTMKSNKSVQ